MCSIFLNRARHTPGNVHFRKKFVNSKQIDIKSVNEENLKVGELRDNSPCSEFQTSYPKNFNI